MTSRTSWIPGNGAGATQSAMFNSSDFTGAQPTTGQFLLSTLVIDNSSATGSLDQYMHISVVQTIASSTVAVGATLVYWFCSLKADGSTYWPPLTAGTAATLTNGVPWYPCATIPLFAAATQTTLVGSTMDTGQPIVMPQCKFRMIVQNNSGFTMTATTQTHDYTTWNINLND